MWPKIVCSFIAFLLCCLGMQVYAEDDGQAKALDVIATFAERICKSAPTSGSSEAVELSGKAKAELTGLVKKVADLGIEGAAKYQSNEYQGVLQKDLAALLSKDADCKFKISEKLIDKLINNVEREVKKDVVPGTEFVGTWIVSDLRSPTSPITSIRLGANNDYQGGSWGRDWGGPNRIGANQFRFENGTLSFIYVQPGRARIDEMLTGTVQVQSPTELIFTVTGGFYASGQRLGMKFRLSR